MRESRPELKGFIFYIWKTLGQKAVVILPSNEIASSEKGQHNPVVKRLRENVKGSTKKSDPDL